MLVLSGRLVYCCELHHNGGIQGYRFGRFRIRFLLAASWVLRTIRRNWRKVGFPTCKRRLARASRQGRLRMSMRVESFREFRIERSEILEPMTLVSPVGMGRSLMQAHRSDWVKVSLSLAPNLNPVAAMYYGFSVFHCMTPPLAQGGPGLGTYMGPPVWKNSCGRPGSPA